MLKKLIVLSLIAAQITEINARGGRIDRTYTDKDGCTHHVTGDWEMFSSYTVDKITACPKHPDRVGKVTTQSSSRNLPKKNQTKKTI